jgi:hypothetical protein
MYCLDIKKGIQTLYFKIYFYVYDASLFVTELFCKLKMVWYKFQILNVIIGNCTKQKLCFKVHQKQGQNLWPPASPCDIFVIFDRWYLSPICFKLQNE